MMWPADQYQLLDFGLGRKLERFGRLILDRESPAAVDHQRAQPELWSSADWSSLHPSSINIDAWFVEYEAVVFKLRVTPFGHVGLFPEHLQHWQWLRSNRSDGREPGRMLNLFAYTGGATLAMAAAGWQVTHVDASAPSVAWARDNAQLSRLTAAPIRWLVEDARLYAARELKRGQRYDAILLDPPSYGHGPKGKAWSIERDLPELLTNCCRLLAPGGRLVLTGHSQEPPLTSSELAKTLEQAGHGIARIEEGRTTLTDLNHRPLDFGWYLRAITEVVGSALPGGEIS